MGVRYTLDGGLLVLEMSGAYESREVVRQFLDALADPACPPRVRLLVDVSKSASLASRPAEEIRMVAEFLGPYADRIGGCCAVVAPSDVHFGLSQMGAARCQAVGVDARVFRGVEDARAWLDDCVELRG